MKDYDPSVYTESHARLSSCSIEDFSTALPARPFLEQMARKAEL